MAQAGSLFPLKLTAYSIQSYLKIKKKQELESGAGRKPMKTMAREGLRTRRL